MESVSRMLWNMQILRNAGYVPEEVSLQKEIVRIEDILATCSDEQLCLAL